jgi:hypothetical protein
MSLMRRVRTRRAITVAAAVLSLAVVTPTAAYASVSATADATARVNGTVYAVAPAADGRTFIGGDFTQVASVTHNRLAAIRANGTVDPAFVPDIDGRVNAVAVSADGATVYVGGTFTSVDGEAHANLAAVDAATGAVRSSWSADTTGDAPDVLGLAVVGTKLYVAGRFTGIDGTTRKRLVALDVSGNVITGFNPAPTGTVRVIAPSVDGTRLFVAGAFNAVGSLSRAGVAELNPTTGKSLAFAVPGVGSLVVAMGISPAGDKLYYGVADNRVLAFDTAGTGTQLWTIKNGGDTQAIDASDTEVYLGGHFGNNITDKVKRQWIESVSPSTGAVTSWDPKLSGGSLGVWAITATPTSLLVGGEFTSADGQVLRRFARFSGTP